MGRWQPAMHTCGLSVDLNAREYLPRVRRVVAGECVDTVHVDMLSGHAPEQYEAAVSQLAHTFEATRCRVVVDRPGRIVLEFSHKCARLFEPCISLRIEVAAVATTLGGRLAVNT